MIKYKYFSKKKTFSVFKLSVWSCAWSLSGGSCSRKESKFNYRRKKNQEIIYETEKIVLEASESEQIVKFSDSRKKIFAQLIIWSDLLWAFCGYIIDCINFT